MHETPAKVDPSLEFRKRAAMRRLGGGEGCFEQVEAERIDDSVDIKGLLHSCNLRRAQRGNMG